MIVPLVTRAGTGGSCAKHKWSKLKCPSSASANNALQKDRSVLATDYLAVTRKLPLVESRAL